MRSLHSLAGLLAAGAACAALIAYFLPRTVPHAWEVAAFAGLLGCSAACVEAARRWGSSSGYTRDLLAVWWLPVILLLPPLYALLAPVPVLVWMQLRVRRLPALRWLLEAGSIALAGCAVSVAFDAVIHIHPAGAEEHQLPGAGHLLASGWGIAMAVLCAVLFTALKTALLAMTGQGWEPAEAARGELPWDAESLAVDGAELCAGITVAILCGLSLPLLLVALPPILLLQRSLFAQQLRDAARTDVKTGLLNAGTWQREAGAELDRAVRAGRPVALLMVDIDHFKQVNDNYGHLTGDQVLLGVAGALSRQSREYDVLGRFGGEEFVMLLPGADADEAYRAAERLRARVSRTVTTADGAAVSVTVSVGVASLRRHGAVLNELLEAADLALYRAKHAGRNRVCLPG